MTLTAPPLPDIVRLLYRGDMWAAAFYLLSSLCLFLLSIVLFRLDLTPGFTYLSVGFQMFSAYCLGKGLYLFVTARKKYLYFLHAAELDLLTIHHEITGCRQRIEKKKNSRRVYVWAIICCGICSMFGFFTAWKSITLGSCIPVALTGMAEVGIGLLTEFRLKEYLRHLLRHEQTWPVAHK